MVQDKLLAEQAIDYILRTDTFALPLFHRAMMLDYFDEFPNDDPSWRRGSLAHRVVKTEALPIWESLDIHGPHRDTPRIILEVCREILDARRDFDYKTHLSNLEGHYRALYTTFSNRLVPLQYLRSKVFTRVDNFKKSVSILLSQMYPIVDANFGGANAAATVAYGVLGAAMDACRFASEDKAYDWSIGPSETDFELDDMDLWDAHFLASIAVSGDVYWEPVSNKTARRDYWLRWVERWLLYTAAASAGAKGDIRG